MLFTSHYALLLLGQEIQDTKLHFHIRLRKCSSTLSFPHAFAGNIKEFSSFRKLEISSQEKSGAELRILTL